MQPGTSFTGLVTFASNNFSAPGNSNFFDITAIDGSNITTGIIKSAGTNTDTSAGGVNNGSAFTGDNAHAYFNLQNGAIATNSFRVQTNGDAAFRGAITMNASSSLSNSLTVGDGSNSQTGTVTISGSTQRVVINDGSQDRVILGKLT